MVVDCNFGSNGSAGEGNCCRMGNVGCCEEGWSAGKEEWVKMNNLWRG